MGSNFTRRENETQRVYGITWTDRCKQRERYAEADIYQAGRNTETETEKDIERQAEDEYRGQINSP